MLKEEVPGGARKFLQDKETLLGKDLTNDQWLAWFSRFIKNIQNEIFKKMCDELDSLSWFIIFSGSWFHF